MRRRETQRRATRLRKQLTDAERKLWFHLRRRQLCGCRFRRQVPLGPFIADFACLEARLVVEVDGGQHQSSISDRARDRYLRQHGLVVLRFWNNDVLSKIDAVLAVIARELGVRRTQVPPPQPSPARGGGGGTR